MENDFAVQLQEVKDRSLRNEGRIKKLETGQEHLNKLATAVEVLAQREQSVESDVKEIKTDVKSITEKPAKRWDGIVDKVLAALAGAFITWLITGGMA